MSDTKKMMDGALDKADAFISGMEAVFKTQGEWKVEEVEDNDIGRIYLVTDGTRKFESRRRDDAEWLLERLK